LRNPAAKSISGKFAEWPGNVQGAAWMLASCFGFSLMVSLVKAASQEINSFEITFFRCFFGLLCLAPFIWARGWQSIATRRLGMHAWRGVLGVTAMVCAYFGVQQLPLATYTAISFSKPLFAIVLAVLILGEKVGWRRWTATLVGFSGILFMTRPGSETFDLNSLFPMGDALSVAILITVLKRMPESETPLVMLFYFGIFASLLSLGPAIWVWRWPDPMHWTLLISIGALGALSQFWWIKAFRAGEASAVAPFDYSRIIFTGLLGLIVFSEFPDRWTMCGAALVVGSTIYIARREARLARQNR